MVPGHLLEQDQWLKHIEDELKQEPALGEVREGAPTSPNNLTH